MAEAVDATDLTDRTDQSAMRAMLPDGVMLLLRRHRNFDGASLSFWEPLVRRHLATDRSLKLGTVTQSSLTMGARGCSSGVAAPSAASPTPIRCGWS